MVIAPKHKSSDAGNSDARKSLKVLPLSEKVNVVYLISEDKKSMLRVLRSSLRINLIFLKV